MTRLPSKDSNAKPPSQNFPSFLRSWSTSGRIQWEIDAWHRDWRGISGRIRELRTAGESARHTYRRMPGSDAGPVEGRAREFLRAALPVGRRDDQPFTRPASSPSGLGVGTARRSYATCGPIRGRLGAILLRPDQVSRQRRKDSWVRRERKSSPAGLPMGVLSVHRYLILPRKKPPKWRRNSLEANICTAENSSTSCDATACWALRISARSGCSNTSMPVRAHIVFSITCRPEDRERHLEDIAAKLIPLFR